MPRIKHDLVLAISRNIKAFLRLDAGLGSGVPDAPETLLKLRDQRIQDLQGRLKKQQPGKMPKDGKKPEGRGLAPASKQREENPTDILKQAHALPEPDSSVRRKQIFRSMISPLKPGKMLDLGTGPGYFAQIAAELGWEVTTVDARTMRRPDPESEADPEKAALIRAIKWVEADVREFPVEDGEYDLISFLGLVHHLGVEDQLKLFERYSHTLMILSARVAPEVVVTEGPYEGWYHREPGETREERDTYPLASWGNDISFHPTEESLIRMLRDSGFSKVFPMRPPHDVNYTFYLCLP